MGDLESTPFSKTQESVPVVGICSVEFAAIKIDARKCNSRFKEINIRFRALYKVECVAGVSAEGISNIRGECKHQIKRAASLTEACSICCIRNVELRRHREHWKFKLHRCDGIFKSLCTYA